MLLSTEPVGATCVRSRSRAPLFLLLLLAWFPNGLDLAQGGPWRSYQGGAGPGQGKHVVLVSGDEEYRSEEALPLLAKILADQHGFRCSVLFAVDPETGIVQPNIRTNIPGLELLDSADLLILFTRFRALPDPQMEAIDGYLKSGRPVLGIRTATHAFQFEPSSRWAHYGNGYTGPETDWEGGFGRLVLGERWVNHHGEHRHESTRGVVSPEAAGHPVVRGLAPGSVWGPTDVYGVRLPLPGDSFPVVLGELVRRRGEFQEDDRFFGMRPDDGPPVIEKNQPMMPIAWTRTYRLPGGRRGRAFTSTIGAAVDLESEGTRRLLVNAVYWCLGMEDQIPQAGTRVDLPGVYQATAYGFHDDNWWRIRRLMPW
jgi:hypothetical protein